ncbi:MAG: class I SAM-dependent methyltransferase [Candidatus Margulisbacteria bacterium]|nr:class I SAM-dependent methyltransferase [Candidatus Margulisiibacteriota bacterium]
MYKEIKKCRICGNENLVPIIDLGFQALTGIFPQNKEQKVTVAPLELVKCMEDENSCGLMQLKHSADLNEMYGKNYGYRSGLNQYMVNHLQEKAKKILDLVNLNKGDLVIDIGSNDATFLKFYPKDTVLVGVDPTGNKFKKFYPEYIALIPDFFSADLIKEKFPSKKAKIITSIAMFYDLENPLKFMQDIHDVLADDGVWVFEQSYMPVMLEKKSYDTICHEHLEYYRLKQIKWMANKIGFKILDIELNDINGGSCSITVAKSNSPYQENTELVNKFLEEEQNKQLNTLKPYQEFKERVFEHKEKLKELISNLHKEGKKILGYGASTKGNVILQFCNITEKDIPFIAEVNAEKFGCVTPGTKIPIISEEQAKENNPDYFIVLPWHFKKFILEKEKEFLNKGGKIIFPLPSPEIIQK